MKIGLLSDTHDHRKRTERALQIFEDHGCEAAFHCGDLMTTDIVRMCSRMPFHFVVGNHDDEQLLRTAAQKTGAMCHGELMDLIMDGRRFMMTHGHLPAPLKSIESVQPDYILVGHSHIAADQTTGTTRTINPGALFRVKVPSVAVLDTQTDSVEFLLVEK